MDVRAAVAFEAGKPLEVTTVKLDGPKAGEVLVEIKATGVCHTDEFTRSGADPEGLFPAILGHEGAGIVVDVGPGVMSVRKGDHVFETYWTTIRGVEAMDNSYALMDLTVYGRQESWEDSPPRWPQQCSYIRTDAGAPDWSPVSVWPGGRPIAQWSRLGAGRSHELGIES